MPECRRGVSGLLIASPQAVGCAQQGVDDAVRRTSCPPSRPRGTTPPTPRPPRPVHHRRTRPRFRAPGTPAPDRRRTASWLFSMALHAARNSSSTTARVMVNSLHGSGMPGRVTPLAVTRVAGGLRDRLPDESAAGLAPTRPARRTDAGGARGSGRHAGGDGAGGLRLPGAPRGPETLVSPA